MEESRKKQHSISNITFEIISDYRAMLMGVAILGIMLFHFAGDSISRPDVSPFITWYGDYIGSSFVDVFLILSGFGLYYSFKKKPYKQDFYKKRALRICIPYVLIGGPAWIWWDFFYVGDGITGFLKNFFFISFFESGVRWFWYILLICVCYLIFPFVFRVFEEAPNRSSEIIYLLVLAGFSMVVSMMFQLNQADFYDHTKIALLRFPAFFVGCYMGKSGYEKRPVPVSFWVILPVIGSLSVLMIPNARTMAAYCVRAINTFGLCMLLILGMYFLSGLKKVHGVIRNVFAWIGKYSLELYMTHLLFRRVLKACGFDLASEKLTLLMWGVSLLLSMLINLIARVISGAVNNKHVKQE